MFWRVLKKDLKRKKTMNVILLLFVMLCSMFAAASINNIITDVEKGSFYANLPFLQDLDVKVGDVFELNVGDLSLRYDRGLHHDDDQYHTHDHSLRRAQVHYRLHDRRGVP